MTGTPQPDWAALRRHAGEFGVSLTDAQVSQLEAYLQLLCEWNRRFNLTAIDDPQEVLVKHFLDSLSCALIADFAGIHSLIDVGTGAGFPGLVLKIAYPHLRVTLLDAVQKRLGFLSRVADALDLRDVQVLHARAEDAAGTQPVQNVGRHRERYDLVTARAVARMNVLAEWTLPLARVGGAALLLKGPDLGEELREAERAIRLLGGGQVQVRELVLRGTDVGRSVVRISKKKPTPKQYPRHPGTARKDPL